MIIKYLFIFIIKYLIKYIYFKKIKLYKLLLLFYILLISVYSGGGSFSSIVDSE